MRNQEATQAAYAAVKLEVIRLVEEHERDGHGGLPCELERRNAIAFLCHGLGVRGDDAMFELEALIADADARCPARSCPDARAKVDPPCCSYPDCTRTARYQIRSMATGGLGAVYSCLVHGPEYSDTFQDWDARTRYLAWEKRKAGKPMPLPADAIRTASEAIALAMARITHEAAAAGAELPDDGSTRPYFAAVAYAEHEVAKILSRHLLGEEAAANG
jgi:hypothetical protein